MSRKKEEILRRFEELRELFPAEPDLVMVEEFAEEIARRTKPPKLREVVTRTLDRKDEPVTHVFDVVKARVGGRLRELVVRSPSKNFSILILADGVTKLSRSYEELEAISPHLEMIDAYEEAENGVYVLCIREMHWTSNFLASILVDEKITFTHLFCLWDEYIS